MWTQNDRVCMLVSNFCLTPSLIKSSEQLRNSVLKHDVLGRDLYASLSLEFSFRCLDCLLICLSIKQLTPNLNAQEFDYEGGETVYVMGDAVRELEAGPRPLLSYNRGKAQNISFQNFAMRYLRAGDMMVKGQEVDFQALRIIKRSYIIAHFVEINEVRNHGRVFDPISQNYYDYNDDGDDDDDDDDNDDDDNGNGNDGYGCTHHNLLLLCMYQWHFTKHITVSCLYYRPPKEVACLILLLASTAIHCYYHCNVAVRVLLEYVRLKTSAVVQTYNTVHFFKSIL
uniref:Uncharacterized protein n=1 Tax=Glossina pallidipes TaxID=7398 RepID=A0A1A9ZUC0_GLOPL